MDENEPSKNLFWICPEWLFDPFLEPVKESEPVMEGRWGHPWWASKWTEMNLSNDWFWFISPSKCSFKWKLNCIGHLEQIWNTFASSWKGDHFGPFCCTPWVTPPPLYPPSWLTLNPNPLKYPCEWELNCISQWGQIRNTFIWSWKGDHFGPFWCTPWVTPPPLQPLQWLILTPNPLKGPFESE